MLEFRLITQFQSLHVFDFVHMQLAPIGHELAIKHFHYQPNFITLTAVSRDTSAETTDLN